MYQIDDEWWIVLDIRCASPHDISWWVQWFQTSQLNSIELGLRLMTTPTLKQITVKMPLIVLRVFWLRNMFVWMTRQGANETKIQVTDQQNKKETKSIFCCRCFLFCFNFVIVFFFPSYFGFDVRGRAQWEARKVSVVQFWPIQTFKWRVKKINTQRVNETEENGQSSARVNYLRLYKNLLLSHCH